MKLRQTFLLFVHMGMQQESRVIANSPAGYRGFYTLGVSSYIKKHYNVSDYKYFGASAGAGNSLFLSFNGNDEEYIDGMLDRVDNLKRPSLPKILSEIKDFALEEYTADDFDLDKLMIGVTCFEGAQKECPIYENFDTLGSAIDCTLVSCNIPFISGSPFDTYMGRVSYDGVFCNYPTIRDGDFAIGPWMWVDAKEYTLFGVKLPRFICRIYEGLFPSRRYKARQLYDMGWHDAHEHRDELTTYFAPP